MEPDAENSRRGLILGKFMPPHRGHQYLVDFARAYTGRLTVLVCSLESEPIPGSLRYRWMRELFPGVDVRHVTDENPSAPGDHPEFWRIWTDTIRRACPEAPELLFTSEAYGWELARRLGARHVPVDPQRELVPVSGTAVREQPLAHWEYLPPCVRPYFLRRVAVVGPESTGKTTLADDLARHFGTVRVSEYARGYLDAVAVDRGIRDPAGVTAVCVAEDIDCIARGQIAAEDALARQATRVLICDTELMTTVFYSEIYFGACPEWIRRAAAERRYDLYLVAAPDVPWVADAQRDRPAERESFFRRCLDELKRRGERYVVVRGCWEERFRIAREAVAALIRGAAGSGAPGSEDVK